MSDLDYNPTNFTRADYQDAKARRQRGEPLSPADKAVLYAYEGPITQAVKGLFGDVNYVTGEMASELGSAIRGAVGDTSTAEAATEFAGRLQEPTVANRGTDYRAPLEGGGKSFDLFTPDEDVAAARRAGAEYSRSGPRAEPSPIQEAIGRQARNQRMTEEEKAELESREIPEYDPQRLRDDLVEIRYNLPRGENIDDVLSSMSPAQIKDVAKALVHINRHSQTTSDRMMEEYLSMLRGGRE